jgi:oligopeptide/dipeptide ABC transporter ATP-binding protein
MMQQQQQQPASVLLQVEGLHKWYPLGGGWLGKPAQNVKAVNGVSFDIHRGEVLSLVGESGSGKSTIGRAILNLDAPTAGQVHFDGKPLVGLTRRQMRPLRRAMQMVFQDPYSSLNPRQEVKDIVRAPLDIHAIGSRRERRARVSDLLARVGLRPDQAENYPHQFSGGQRQRIGIARALAVDPQIIVCDEPVSALDVSVQAQILNLLIDLQRDLGLSYLFISHDLGVVKHISDRVAVMYLGRLVEVAARDLLFRSPGHPYTELLLRSAPPAHPRERRGYAAAADDVPRALDHAQGCPFHPRCGLATDRCRDERPALTPRQSGQLVACHHR